MSSALTGFGGSIGLGEEVTWGTPVARTRFIEVTRATLNQTISREPRKTLGQLGSVSTNYRGFAELAIDAGGDIETYLEYDNPGITLLLKHCMGAVASSAGPAPYTHTFTLDKDLPPGLTIEQIHGSQAGIDAAEVFDGARITTFEISSAARERVMLKIPGIIARVSGGLVAAGVAAYVAAEEVLAHQAAQLTWNGNTFDLLDFSVKVDRKLERRPHVGSKLTGCPAISDQMDVTFSGTAEWDDNNLPNDFVSGAQSDAVLTFTGVTGAGPNSLSITLHNLLLESVDKPVDKVGTLTQAFTGRAFSDGTDEGLTIVVVNDNATAV
jgi:hypothetical protein